ncbi:unnamed protein product [Citrullus colocynthis]|uniref:Uncharacterized protein n=1 Tax=Citrullus colocynthis TaxID=252529 RepID=A0ABP0XZV9_9ROSI
MIMFLGAGAVGVSLIEFFGHMKFIMCGVLSAISSSSSSCSSFYFDPQSRGSCKKTRENSFFEFQDFGVKGCFVWYQIPGKKKKL